MHGVDKHFQDWLIFSSEHVSNRFKVKDFLHQFQVIIDRIYHFNHKWMTINLKENFKLVT